MQDPNNATDDLDETPRTDKKLSFPQMTVVRVVAAIAQGATILITWPLWTERDFPPVVALVPIDFPWGLLLLLSLLLVVAWPKVGVPLHVFLLILSVVADQIRLQPYIVAIAVIMIGTLPYRNLKMFARAFLLSMWFFAGLHKIIAFNGYIFNGGITGLINGAFPWLSSELTFVFAALAPVMEISVAALLLFKRTRQKGVMLAIALHIGILAVLISHGYNYSVWPWNVVIGIAAICFFYNWQESFTDKIRQQQKTVQVILLATMIYPIGYYFHLVEANLAHVLYSPKLTSVVRTDSGDRYSLSRKSEKMTRAFLPHLHRIHIEVFRKTANPDDVLILTDPRPFSVKKRIFLFDDFNASQTTEY